MQDEIEEVLRLIAQPIKCRNKLISGESKFVLNSCILYKLNKVLDIIENDSVDIILSEGQRKSLELFLKIISIIPKLVVTQRSAESFDNVIDLRKFKQLRYLELTRVCLENTVGIDKLKTQLETFVCNRSTKYIQVVFKQKKLQWAELKCLDLRYSQLSEIDRDFFKHMPWIQTLDLSLNKLSSIDGLQCLDHLRCLNLSFNHLEKCPALSKEVENKLEILMLNNNHITTLSELPALDSLKTLDLSSNWITNKKEFLFLSPLKTLSCLKLFDNPVSFIKYYRIYVASSLGENINAQKLVLDNQPLSNHERTVLGKRCGSCHQWSIQEFDRSSSTLNTIESIRDERPPETKKEVKVNKTIKRLSKPREVIIQDIPPEGIHVKPKVVSSKQVIDNFKLTENTASGGSYKSTSEKEIALMKQLADFQICVETQPESSTQEVTPCQDNGSETTKLLISATVHAHDECEEKKSETSTLECDESNKIEVSSEKPDEITENTIEKNCESTVSEEVIEECIKNNEELQIFSSDAETYNNGFQEYLKNPTTNVSEYSSNINPSLSEESDSELSDTEDEVLWHVQRKNNVTGVFQNIILVLLDDELKERNTSNHHVIAHWPLSTVQSCIKTKTDPITVEIEFDTLKKDKRSRTYIMEFADAQVLLKKMYSILEARPLSDMNQKTYKCIKCTALFVHDIPSAFKTRGSLVSCSICSSTLVVEIEEPRLPEPKEISLPVVSHSSSQSSIGKGYIKGEETPSKDWKTQCSAASLEPGLHERKSSYQRYESDIEVISNPSQSSIEVLDEHSRSATPRRKISLEEKQGVTISAASPLSTVLEVNSPFANLTESSSSGSLTESVITAYEALNINRKKFYDEEVLTEEESFPSSELHLPGTIEEQIPTSIWRNECDIYSFVDFTDVDARVKLYLYQILFEDDNEVLLMITRCHLWKTGGSDYDGCIVISNLKIYFLSHSRTNFKEDTCDWLSKFDCYNLKDVKEFAPLIWHQGARIQIKHICYMALLMESERNLNFFKFLKGLSLEGIKIQNNCSNSSELALQQAVLSACSINKSVDPTVNFFTICLSITILKDDVEDETLRLGGLALTTGEFHIIPGELSWLVTTSEPSVVTSQEMSSLIEVERGAQLVNLHFLDEKEALEEVWSLKCTSNAQVSSIVDAIRLPWEQLFSVSLDVTTVH